MSAEDFFSGGTPSAKFPEIGTTVAGRIVNIGEKRQAKDFATGAPRVWDDGNPVYQLPIELATDERDPAVADDDGTRTLWVQAGTNMQKAIASAIRQSGAKLAEGGRLAVTYVADGTAKQRGFNPPKLYDAHYQPPAKSAADFFNQGTPAEQPAAPAAAVNGDPANKVDLARTLIGSGLDDNAVADATGLPVVAVAALRANSAA